MSNLKTARFEGSIKELSIYHLAVLDTTSFINLFNTAAEAIKNELLIPGFDTDATCSWCIVEAVKRGFPELLVLGHELNDRYESVYDTFFLGEENVMRRKLLPYLSFQSPIKALKVMPLLDKTFVAIGT